MKAVLSIVGIIVLFFAIYSHNQNTWFDLKWFFLACILLVPGFFAVCMAISKNTQPPHWR